MSCPDVLFAKDPKSEELLIQPHVGEFYTVDAWELHQRRRIQAEEEVKEWKKSIMLREALSAFRNTEDGKLLDRLLMEEARGRFRTAFPKDYCTSFLREVKIQMFQRTNRERFISEGSRQAVVKEFEYLCFRSWNLSPGELPWRRKGFICSGETLGHLQSVARNFEPTEEVKGRFKLPWRKSLGEEYYNLCKAAAIGDEKAYCVLDSPDLNINGRADRGEFIVQGHNLGDIVKDTIKSIPEASETTVITTSSQMVP